MEQKQPTESRFALLIDADNVSAKYIKPIMDELSKYGTVTYKRIYGDWTSTLHAKWKDTLLDNSLTPIQQFSYTTGKNATDSAMIIDAMDILYTRSVEGFCIVSSDSDFTRLASRIRESGLTVIGMGEKKTPTAFRKACDIFTTLELLVRSTRDKANGGHTTPKSEIEQAVVTIITDNQNNGKSTGLGEVGSRLLKQYPDFDVRSYGTNLLSKLLGEFESVDVIRDGSNVAVVLSDAADVSHAKAASDGEGDAAANETGNATTEGANETAAEKDAEPKRTRRRRKSKVINAESPKDETVEGAADEAMPTSEHETGADAESAAGVSNDVAEDEETESTPAKRTSSRTRRGSRGGSRARGRARKAEEADAPAQAEGADVAEMAPRLDEAASAANEQRIDEAVAANVADEPASDAPVEETPETTAAETAAEGAAADTSDAPARPKRTRRGSRGGSRARSKAAAKAAAEAEAEALDASDGEASALKVDAADAASGNDLAARVGSYVRDAVRTAGAAGVDINDLVAQVRANFKSFKVRDLGYKQFKAYVADLGDIVVEKQGKTSVARLGE